MKKIILALVLISLPSGVSADYKEVSKNSSRYIASEAEKEFPEKSCVEALTSESLSEAEKADASLFKNKPITNPFFYQASLDGKTIFILGSFHLGVSLDDLPPVVRHKAESSDLVVAETKTSKTSLTSGLKMLWQFLFGTKVSSRVSPEAWAKAKLIFEKNGIPPFVADRLGLGMGSAMLALNGALASKGKNVPTLDDQIKALAMTSRVPIAGLESDQPSIVAATKLLDDPKVFEALVEGLYTDEDLPNREVAHHLNEYRSGNEAADLARYNEMSPDNRNSMVDARNKKWASQFDSLLHSSNSQIFVVVGSLHLWGETGVLAYFKSKGAKVVRVPIQNN